MLKNSLYDNDESDIESDNELENYITKDDLVNYFLDMYLSDISDLFFKLKDTYEYTFFLKNLNHSGELVDLLLDILIHNNQPLFSTLHSFPVSFEKYNYINILVSYDIVCDFIKYCYSDLKKFKVKNWSFDQTIFSHNLWAQFCYHYSEIY